MGCGRSKSERVERKQTISTGDALFIGRQEIRESNETPFNQGICLICRKFLTFNVKTLRCSHKFHGECFKKFSEFYSGSTKCPFCEK